MRTICIEGDSTAYGNYDCERGGWAHRVKMAAMARSLESPLEPVVVDNHGFPGNMITRINPRYKDNLVTPAQMGEVVSVLQTGFNEARILPGREESRVSVQRFGEQLLRFSEISDAYDAQQVFVSTYPVDEARTTPTWSGSYVTNSMLEDYAGEMRRVADETDTPFVDLHMLYGQRDINTLLADDGFHANHEGHRIIGSVVMDLTDLRA